jgi:hypothetical protein
MRGWRGQRGQTAVEYLGALLVVATVVSALATSGAGTQLRHAVADRVCAIARGETACAGAPRHHPHAGRESHGTRVPASAASASTRSPGARRVARANRRARRAIFAALLHPWGKPLQRADAAIKAFEQTLRYCTDGDRRPPTRGCPGLTSDDTSVEQLLGIYRAAHAVHDTLAAIWNAIQHAGDHKPTQKEIDQAVTQFIVEAAVSSGARTEEDVRRFARAHQQDIDDGIAAVANQETNLKGGEYIARGARDPDLREAIRQLYRANAKVGDGGTADKLIQEVAAGCRRAGCEHWQKAVGRRTSLIKILSKPSLSADERAVAGELIANLNKAIARAGGP